MKFTRNILMILSAAAIMACSEDIQPQNEGSELQLSVTIASDTRTSPAAPGDAASQFNAGDRLEVSEKGGSRHSVYTYDGSNWTSAAPLRCWDPMYITATYPAGSTSATVSTDQSTAEAISRSDYMTYESSAPEGNVAHITMRRHTARVIVNMCLSADYDGTEPEITDMLIHTAGEDGKIISIKPYRKTGEDGTISYTALVNASTGGAAGDFVSFFINGKKMYFGEIPAFDACSSYTYNLKVGISRCTLGSISVEPWGSSTIVEGMESGKVVSATLHTIGLAEAGTLTYEDITEALAGGTDLTIYGPMNGTDLNKIRHNDAIGSLNLKHAQIVAGGEGISIIDEQGNEGDEFQVVDNILTAYLFQNSPIRSVIVPDGVHSIGYKAFQNSSVESIILPEGLTYIDFKAFADASLLRSIRIPSGVTLIENNTFENCRSLEKIEFAEGSQLEHIQYDIISGCESLTQLILPESVKIIDGAAFSDAPGLKLIRIPSGVTVLNQNLLSNCTSLEKIEFAEGSRLEQVDENFVSGCENLRQLSLPEGLKTVGSGAFRNSYLQDITLPASLQKIAGSAFQSITNNGTGTLTIKSGKTTAVDAEVFKDYKASGTELVLNSTWYDVDVAAGRKPVIQPDGTCRWFGATFRAAVTLPDAASHLFHSVRAGSLTPALVSEALAGGSTLNLGGVLNGSDMALVRSTALNGLTTLNMEDADIVAGGSPASQQGVIGSQMLSGTRLTTLVLPRTLKSISSGAFSGTPLTRLTIYSGATTAQTFSGMNTEACELLLDHSMKSRTAWHTDRQMPWFSGRLWKKISFIMPDGSLSEFGASSETTGDDVQNGGSLKSPSPRH